MYYIIAGKYPEISVQLRDNLFKYIIKFDLFENMKKNKFWPTIFIDFLQELEVNGTMYQQLILLYQIVLPATSHILLIQLVITFIKFIAFLYIDARLPVHFIRYLLWIIVSMFNYIMGDPAVKWIRFPTPEAPEQNLQNHVAT